MEIKDLEKLSTYIDENLVDIVISNSSDSGKMKKVKESNHLIQIR